MNETLPDAFSPVSKEDWIKQALHDIKGKDFETTLTSLNLDGIRIQPYYSAEDSVVGLEGYRNAFHPHPETPGFPARMWANVGTFRVDDEKVSNQEILHALMNGIDGILLKIDGPIDWGTIFKDVGVTYIKLYLETNGDAIDVFESLTAWAKASGIDPNELKGGILWDGFVNALQIQQDRESLYTSAAALIGATKEYPNFLPISVQFSHYHQSGATAVKELAYGFASLIELIDGLENHGISAADVFSNCLLRVEAGADFFMEIAKIKSARVMFHQFAALYGVSIEPEGVEIFAGTSFWTKSSWDVNTNLLRNTSEAMIAILGGSNSLAVGTHDFSDSDFSIRMARNISNILKDESFLDKLIDPAAGSYYVEVLIQEILQKTKSKLIEIEQIGGWWKAFELGQIQLEIREVREKRMQSVVEVKSPRIGVNKYALKESRPTVALPHEEAWQLLAWRETLLFEHQNQNPA